MKKYICPFCGKELSRCGIHHIYKCDKGDKSLSKDEIKILYLKKNFGDNIVDSVINDYKNLYSLPMLREKYDIDYKSSIFILEKNGVPIRNISESAKKISANKIKKTCLNKYGVENPSQCSEIKKKKEVTFLKHYGVDNIWKTKDYTKNIWNSYTEERKQDIIKKIYKTINERKTRGSKIELRVAEMLDNLGIQYQRQFLIKQYPHPYDIWLVKTKIIIEVNGRWWHADPRFYKENDTVKLPGEKRNLTAKEIWEKDQKWFDYASKNGYKIIILWEDDINNKNDEELTRYIINEINK